MKLIRKNAQRFLGLVMCCVMLAGTLSAWPALGHAREVLPGELGDNAGVYGWRVMKKADGAFVGGVRYPGNVGNGPVMSMDGQSGAGDQYFPNMPRVENWGQYVEATVFLGTADSSLSTQAEQEAFAKTIMNDYRIDVFMVDVNVNKYENGEYPYAWVSHDIIGAEYNADNGRYTLTLDHQDGLKWDYDNRTGGSAPAVFAVDVDRTPNTAAAGVYGWRIRDNTGAIVGGVRYPYSVGGGNPQMDVSGYFTGATYVGDGWGNPYEIAKVDLGVADRMLDDEESRAIFSEQLMERYTLEIFFVDANGGMIGSKYPCAWVPYEITGVDYRSNSGREYTIALQFDDVDSLYWDYSTRTYEPDHESNQVPGSYRYKATFAVTVMEPESISSNRATAWGVVGDDDFSLMTDYQNWHDVLGRELEELYHTPLDWPVLYKLKGGATEANIAAIVQDLKKNYRLQVVYRDYANNRGEQNPLTVSIPIKSASVEERGDGYIVLKITPAVAHRFFWHWTSAWVDDVNGTYPLEYKLRIRIGEPVSDETAALHHVTDRVVNPPKTTVNFFDYWLEDGANGRWANDFEAYAAGTESEVITKGINKDHLLVFMGSFAFPGANGCDNISNLGRWNVWTGDVHYAPYPDSDADTNGGYGSDGSSSNSFTEGDPDGILKPHRGIVAKTLENGYPRLALGKYAWLTPDDYLGRAKDYSNIYPPSSMGGAFDSFFADVVKDDEKGRESLDYLFDPTKANNYKHVVADTKGLFQMDEQGYYYFDSRKNFAELVEGGGMDENGKPVNIIKLYDEPWKISASIDVDNATTAAKGQFFPFNEWKSLFHEIGNGGVEQDHYNFRDQNRAAVRPINHYFGMTVETEFQQPIGGTITQGRVGGGGDIPMEFSFSGDDDVWIFIDDVLVGDLGGIHNPVGININFATGVIEYTAIDAPGGETKYYKTSLKEQFTSAGRENEVVWDGETFANGSIHTLKFYYMERGNDVSNCSIRFNTLPVSKDSIRKIDDSGEILRGARFDLYSAVKNGNAFVRDGAPIAMGLVMDNDKENPNLYTIQDANGKVIDFTEFVSNLNARTYFILNEETTPAGFRANPDIVLEFHPETYTFTVLNKYETGAYASFSAEWKQILEVEVYDATLNAAGELVKGNKVTDSMKDGLTVVVPLIRTGGNWLPMFGSNTKGWNTVERGNQTLKTDLALAALLQIADEDYPNWYMNWLRTGASANSQTGNLFGNMMNLPGDATRYVINQAAGNNQNADLTLVALFLPGSTLNKLNVQGATDDERYEDLHRKLQAAAVTDVTSARSFLNGKAVGEGDLTLLYSNDFSRNYRTVIYVPNERRELRVRKVDEEGKYVNGAVFALFDTAADAAAYTTRATDLNGVMAELASAKGKGGLRAYGATATVDLETSDGQQEGLLIFREGTPVGATAASGYAMMQWPAQRGSGSNAQDTYWLKEIYAPSGYVLNRNLVRVEVGNSAIYANATGYDASGNMLTGEAAENDGITVQAALGKLAQTLTKYAIGNKVDVTLRDITITKQINQAADRLPADGSGWSDAQPAESINLHYGINSRALTSQYGRHEGDGEPPVFTATDGYIRVMPRQNQTMYADHDNTVKRDNLSGIDLDGLFGLMNVVVVENRKLTGNLSVSKQVTGDALDDSDLTEAFSFAASFTGSNGKPLSGTYGCVSSDGQREGSITLTGAVGEVVNFKLAHGQTINIYDLPIGTTFTVTEGENEKYAVTVTNAQGDPSDGKGVIVAEASAGLVFVNEKIPAPPTEEPTNPPKGNLTVAKTVELGSKTKKFTFSVSLGDRSISGPYGDMYFKDGEATFTLSDGESKTAVGLPVGVRYEVVETSANTDGYRLSSSTGDKGIIAEQGCTATFVNVSVPVTGDNSHLELWLALLVLSAVSIGVLAIGKRTWLDK